MELPEAAPVPIIDSFVQLTLGGSVFYPKAVLDFVNRRGSGKLIYAGYWPLLSYERIFAELSQLELREEVWPRFLNGNATTAFGLEKRARGPVTAGGRAR
jgi:predicted TIM-barrel fold metal-dependent hydrolase